MGATPGFFDEFLLAAGASLPTGPEKVRPVKPPDLTQASDRTRIERAAREKPKGRRSTIVSGYGGVSDSPLGIKTLVGS